jgi:hypothetical protein
MFVAIKLKCCQEEFYWGKRQEEKINQRNTSLLCLIAQMFKL